LAKDDSGVEVLSEYAFTDKLHGLFLTAPAEFMFVASYNPG